MVVSTLVINQIISKGSIIFLKIGESSHGEIDAYITPVADVVRETLDKIEYDQPALLNYTAVNEYYNETNPEILDTLLLAPRKVFSGVKILGEAVSGHYTDSKVQRDYWHQSFDKTTNLPHRGDAYHVDFPSGLDDNTIVAFKTEREREIHIGRDYSYEPMGIGECRVVKSKDGSDRGVQDGEIIFIRQGPFNLLPLVEEYDKINREMYGGAQKAIMEGKHGLSERELQKRERGLINAYI